MYRQVFIPNEQNPSVMMPREWYGKEIEVIAYPLVGERYHPVLQSQAKRLEAIRSVTKDIHLDLSKFKFNRDAANDYDE
ncbi:MAG: hypothetical protein LBR49_05180 [Tannerella sp.]|jgi:hypothetical protein|nr:hypothetical protein [Tannerella sp.]